MGTGTGGDRPYAPKEPKKGEFDVESLFNAYRNLQRRKKHLRGVRLELVSKPSEYGHLAHYQPGYTYIDPETDKPVAQQPVIRLFLPALKKTHETWSNVPQTPMSRYSYMGKDLTKYAMEVLRHEVAHPLTQRQEEISGRPDVPIPPGRQHPSKGLGWGEPPHGLRYNILNKMLRGAGQTPIFEKVGLPREFALPQMRSRYME